MMDLTPLRRVVDVEAIAVGNVHTLNPTHLMQAATMQFFYANVSEAQGDVHACTYHLDAAAELERAARAAERLFGVKAQHNLR